MVGTRLFRELAYAWRDVPSVADVAGAIDASSVREMPIPHDCVDGFLPAFWRRPNAYLNAATRDRMSGLRMLDPAVIERGLHALRDDLSRGVWAKRNAPLVSLDQRDVGWRLIAG